MKLGKQLKLGLMGVLATLVLSSNTACSGQELEPQKPQNTGVRTLVEEFSVSQTDNSDDIIGLMNEMYNRCIEFGCTHEEALLHIRFAFQERAQYRNFVISISDNIANNDENWTWSKLIPNGNIWRRETIHRANNNINSLDRRFQHARDSNWHNIENVAELETVSVFRGHNLVHNGTAPNNIARGVHWELHRQQGESKFQEMYEHQKQNQIESSQAGIDYRN